MNRASSYKKSSLSIALSCVLGVLAGSVAFAEFASQAGADYRMTDARAIADLSKHLDELAAQDEFSGTVLIAKNGKLLFAHAYGYANHAFKVPNKLDTKFNLGSMGKMFTAVSILQLAQAGKLSLDDKLIKLVPDYPDKDIASKITIYQLLTHTSGLGDMFNEQYQDTPKDKFDTIQAHLPLFTGKPLLFEPGTKWSYSNAGFIVLGLVIERVSGQSYYEYVREHVFKPAGMTSTDNYKPHDDVPNLAIGGSARASEPRPTIRLLFGRTRRWMLLCKKSARFMP
jgi:CubicO group peptidase (beta-lactamase class C family)